MNLSKDSLVTSLRVYDSTERPDTSPLSGYGQTIHAHDEMAHAETAKSSICCWYLNLILYIFIYCTLNIYQLWNWTNINVKRKTIGALCVHYSILSSFTMVNFKYVSVLLLNVVLEVLSLHFLNQSVIWCKTLFNMENKSNNETQELVNILCC